MGLNAHVVDVPEDWNISSTFKIKVLVAYDRSLVISSNPSFETEQKSVSEPAFTSPTPQTILLPPNIPLHRVKHTLDDQGSQTREVTTFKYFVRWKGHPEDDAIWTPRGELQHLDPDLPN